MELLRIYAENVYNFNDMERLELFRQICIDMFDMYKNPLNYRYIAIAYDYEINLYNKITIYYVEITDKYQSLYDIKSLKNFHEQKFSYQFFSSRIPKELYVEIMKKIEIYKQ